MQAARRIVDARAQRRPPSLDEQDSKALLRSFGIETAVGLFARSAMEARQAAQQLGFPVVLKVRADGITHKSDVGGVHARAVPTADEVERGFEAIAPAAWLSARPRRASSACWSRKWSCGRTAAS